MLSHDADLAAYIVGLPDTYRGHELERQLSEAGIPFERVDGVRATYNGRPVADYADQAAARVFIRRDLTAGEIGCALAHREACLRLLRSNRQHVLVLEDDARAVRPGALVSVLAPIRVPVDAPAIICLYARSAVAASSDQRGDTTAGRLLLPPFSTVAYLINRAAASLIVEEGLPLVGPADWPRRVAPLVRFCYVSPWQFVPAPEDHSLIGPSRRHPEPPLGARVLRTAASISQLRWILHREAFGTYAAFWSYEIVRPITSALLRLAGLWPVTRHESPPLAPRWLVAVNRLLGGRTARR